MSDQHLLRDLAGDVRERVITPSYDEVSRRVRARRLRGAAGSVAAVLLVVGGIAVSQNVLTTAGPTTPQPAQTDGPLPMTDGSLWREVVDGTDSHPFEVEGTDDGAIAVVWRALEPGSPTFALVIREADGTVHGRRLDEPVVLTAAPGGWVATNSSRGWFVASDGQWTPLGQTTTARPARAGDVVVHGNYATWLFSPEDRTLSPTGLPLGADGYVTPEGGLVTCQQDGRGEIFVSPTDKLIRSLPGSTCVVAGRGDDLAVVVLGDDPDGGVPMTGLATRTDLTWRLPRVTDLLDGVTSVVVTSGGSTVVTNADDGRWFLVGTDGRLSEPERKVGEAFVAGDRLYVTSYGLMNGPIFSSDDDGATWTQTTLPGNESRQD